MRTKLIILTILLSSIYGCKKTGEVNITGKITGKIPEKITYTLPLDGIAYFGFNESVKPDSLGNFKIKLMTGQPAFVIINIPGLTPKTIVVEPRQSFDLSVNTETKGGSFRISGPDESGQNFYNTLPTPEFVQLEARKYYKISSQDSTKSILETLKQNELASLNELLKKKEISTSFFDLVSLDRDCYYADLMTQIQYTKYIINVSRANPDVHYEFPEEMKKAWEQVYVRYPPVNFIRSQWWFDYVQTYLNCQEYLSKEITIRKLREMSDKGIAQTHKIEVAKRYLSPRELEYYTAAHVFFECYEFEEFNREFIKIFENFKIQFPESKYTSYLASMVNPIILYYAAADKDFGDGIKFIENYNNVNTLKDGLKSFKGKKVFVDVWASWCAPCKAEFKTREKLMNLFKPKGIEVLYISIDEDRRDKTWTDMIKYYNLRGYHMRANSDLAEDLKRIQNQKGSFFVPWHILIDEQGNRIEDLSEIAAMEAAAKL